MTAIRHSITTILNATADSVCRASDLLLSRRQETQLHPLATDIPALDTLLGGGLSRGSLTELIGRPSSADRVDRTTFIRSVRHPPDRPPADHLVRGMRGPDRPGRPSRPPVGRSDRHRSGTPVVGLPATPARHPGRRRTPGGDRLPPGGDRPRSAPGQGQGAPGSMASIGAPNRRVPNRHRGGFPLSRQRLCCKHRHYGRKHSRTVVRSTRRHENTRRITEPPQTDQKQEPPTRCPHPPGPDPA